MIAPDMATMLSFVFTDAPIAAPAAASRCSPRRVQPILQRHHRRQRHLDLRHAADVRDRRRDEARRAEIANAADPRLAAFQRALDKLLLDLAQQVVRDGEGARKFVEISVEGAASDAAAKRIALSIANSPLVKTAFAGEDANWGRVVMAVGKAGEKAERDKLDIFFGDIRVAHEGQRDPDYGEAAASAYMKKPEDRHRASTSTSARRRQRCGPATSPRNTSPSTATIVREAAARRRRRADRRRQPRADRPAPEGKQLAGLWEFPGGKLDAGERPEEALIRELREELGIEVKAACLAPLTFASHAYDDFHLLMPLYVCRRWEGFVQPREGQALKWVRPAKACAITRCRRPTRR